MADMKGKRCLVTGATQGIGRVAALELAKAGASVVIVGRDPARTQETVQALRQQSGNPEVEAIVGDLALLEEVRRVAREYSSRYSRLDVLLNNAGALFGQRQLTSEGYERTFALNHLAYFALTRDLLELLGRGAPSRVVNLASAVHSMARIDFDDLMTERSYTGMRAYSRSKLANVMFTLELARRLQGRNVTATCVHPGMVLTNFGQGNLGLMGKLIGPLLRPFTLRPEQGADTPVWLASSPEVEGVTGKYFIRRKERKVNRQALDAAARERLWDVSEQLVNRVAP
ncbi:SDR family oxidoreductase [Hyalangium gracile]|uniref:SDR family oxidoreductase n=1 Tax=Hyalangium gracile TaxID=394092 RepID=UPI001CCD4B98|nr:SDR family oxidoreductase [Hyalangium gracile]